MNKLQNAINPENIEDVEYSDIMSNNYVSYAMSVIISRAVPDVRDGLKPVQRRILYDMKQLGTDSNKPHRKSARITGDTMGKYHPHGNCLSGDTRVFLLNGKIKTIRDLFEEGKPVWILSVNSEGSVVPAKAHSFRIGQKTKDLYDIKFTDGSVITSTSNHQFQDIDGNWVQAKDLHKHMILSTARLKDNFDSCNADVKVNNRPSMTFNLRSQGFIQKIVADACCDKPQTFDRLAIHHIDSNTFNNDPSNLSWLTFREHNLLHQSESDVYVKGLAKGSEIIQNDEELQNQRVEKNHVLSSVYAKYSGVFTAYKIIQYMIDNNIDLTHENYESFRKTKQFYNVPFVERMVEKGYVESWDNLVDQVLTGDTIQSKINIFDYLSYGPRHSENICENTKSKKGINNYDPKSSGRLLIPVITAYRNTEFTREPEYLSIKNTSGYHTLSKYFTEKEYREYRDSYLAIIESVNIRQVSTEVNMYDFTVDDYENMLVLTDDRRMIVAHNSSIYEAMVNMSQDWKKGQSLVDGHGNFGSIEGDGAAAERYTEARLEKFSEDVFLEDLKYDVADMVPNYDETEKEPDALPCKVPNILINGTEGIAVGMATSIPTHNTSEVIDATISYLRGTKKVETLMKQLPGPDFPTGGIISNKNELLNVYKTGKGRIRIRGKIEFEKGGPSQKDRLVVTEIPYTMIGQGIHKFLQDVAKLCNDKVITEITDIINQSSGPDIRIVLELKNNADIERIKNILYSKTKLEDTFGVNMLVIDKGTPKVMNLLNILDSFIEFQNQIYTRKFQKLLDQANKKKEITEGLIDAIDMIDVIIEILRGSKKISQAKDCLVSGITKDIVFKTKDAEKIAKKMNFTAVQADAILSMQLSRLVGLQLDELKADFAKLIKDIEQYTNLLENPEEMKKEIIKYLQSIKKKYGRDRRTQIDDIVTPNIETIEIPKVELMALIDKSNYIHAIEKSSYSRNRQYIDENYEYVVDISSRDKLAVFTDIGKVHMIPMKDVPLQKPRDKGTPIDNICQFEYSVENIVGVEALHFKTDERQFVFVTDQGYVKRTKNSDFFINRKMTDSTVLREGENVFRVFLYDEDKPIIFETQKGLVLKELQSDIKQKSKYSMGNVGIKLNKGDSLKLVTYDDTGYKGVRKSSFGNTGKVRQRKLM